MFSASSFAGSRSATSCKEKTLADLMRTAMVKSRRFSSSKSKAPMHQVVLQNRMVKVVNQALAENPLSITINKLDDTFINANKTTQQQDQPKPFKFSPKAAVFTPSATKTEQKPSENTFSLQRVDSEEAW